MDRRMTLGALSQSALNSGKSGPSRVSAADGLGSDYPVKSRMSMAPVLSTSRKSSLMPTNSMPRKSTMSIMPRQSSSMQPRASTGGSNSNKSDPRNINDKSFIGSSIRILLDYLTEHNYPHAISPKILTRPSSKDFNNIVLFLFVQIDVNFKLSGKFEDEIIAMFKQLRYPYPISKTSLVAVGTPATWPPLLATIIWLIELLSYDQAVIQSSLNEDEDVNVDYPNSTDKSFFSYLSSAYHLFLNGDDDRYDALEREYLGSFEVRNNSIMNQIASIEERNAALQSEIAVVQGRCAHLPDLLHRQSDYLKDIDKFKALIEQLQRHKEQLQGKSRERQVELSRLEEAVLSARDEIEGLKATIATQELSPDDVRRMNEERERIESSLAATTDSKAAVQKRVWEAEDALRVKVQALEDSGRTYTTTAEDLKLVPRTARNARDLDLTIEIDIRAKKKTDVLRGDIRGLVVPTLRDVRSELFATLENLRSEVLTAQDAIDEADLKLQESLQQRTLTESKLKRIEEAYAREKEALDSAVSSYTSEVDAIEGKLARLRDTSALDARLNTANRRLTEIQSSRQLRAIEHRRQTREMMEEIMEAVSLCAGHREMVQEKLGGLVQVYRGKVERMLLGVDDERTPGRDERSESGLGSASSMGKQGDDDRDDEESHMGGFGQARCGGRGNLFGNISPIGATQTNAVESIDAQDSGNESLLVANISRAAPDLDPRKVVSNLAGLINKCAMQDRNVLDDSALAVDI